MLEFEYDAELEREVLLEEAIEQGIEQGIEQVALNMLRKGMAHEDISGVTGLSLERLEALYADQLTLDT